MKKLSLTQLVDDYSILRLDPNRPVPSPLDKPHAQRQLVSITRTDRELSLVCPTAMSQQVKAEPEQRSNDWVCFEVDGPLEFSETGILARISNILAQADIPIFVVSSFDTDYLMVAQRDQQGTITCLREAGISVSAER